MSIYRYYWDAAVFHALFNEEENRVADCQQISRMAEEGTVKIVTSTLTLVECVRLKNEPRRLTPANEATLKRYFENPFIEFVNVTRKIGEDARRILWENQRIQYKDAIHVATALYASVDKVMTYDRDFLALRGDYGLQIEEPRPPQGELFSR